MYPTVTPINALRESDEPEPVPSPTPTPFVDLPNVKK
jgi:hypothetical protein